jgi:hypothetical protein
MEKRRKKIKKTKASRGILALFRRKIENVEQPVVASEENKPQTSADATLSDNSTLRLAIVSDDSAEREVAPGPALRSSDAGSLAPQQGSAASHDSTAAFSPKRRAAEAASQAYRRLSADEMRRRHPSRRSPLKRVDEVRVRRSEGGLFAFIFSLIGLVIRMTIVVVLVGAIGAFVGYEMVRFYVRTEEVVVPNVRGMKEADALDVLAQKKLGLLKERVEPNPLVAPGEIIEQKPPPGGKAKQGTLVRVVVSSGRANYIVPDVVGERRENAVNKIRGAGLEVGDISYLESETVPRDCVISQNPEPNKGLEKSEPVHLLLSKGPPKSSASPLPTPAGAAAATPAP